MSHLIFISGTEFLLQDGDYLLLNGEGTGKLLRITDGVTTADLSSNIVNTSYAVAAAGWAPSIATLRRSTLGGAGPYDDVIEEIPVMVLGSTAGGALANLATLSQLLDQAERWARGEPVAAVRIEYQPEGCPALLQAVILGRTADAPGLALPLTFHSEIGAWIIDNVRLRFRRRGLWLGPAEIVTSAAFTTGNVVSLTMSGAPAIASPTDIQLDCATQPATATKDGFIVVSTVADAIQVLEGEALADGGKWTSVADSANHARGGSVLRYTPTNTSTNSSALLSIGSMPDTCDLFAVLAAVRNNSSTKEFQLRAGLEIEAYPNIAQSVVGSYVTIPPYVSSVDPVMVSLGILAMPSTAGLALVRKLWLTAIAESASGPPTLDIDYVVVAGLRPNVASIIRTPLAWTYGYYTLQRLIAQTQALTAMHGRMLGGLPAVQQPIPYQGDAYVSTVDTNVSLLWMQATGTSWQVDNLAGDVMNVIATAARYPAFLTPQ